MLSLEVCAAPLRHQDTLPTWCATCDEIAEKRAVWCLACPFDRLGELREAHVKRNGDGANGCPGWRALCRLKATHRPKCRAGAAGEFFLSERLCFAQLTHGTAKRGVGGAAVARSVGSHALTRTSMRLTANE